MHQIGARFYRGEQTENAFNVMGLMLEPIVEAPGDGKGSLVAWDPVAQKARWTVQHEHLWNGGTLATAGDLVFQGTADGSFAAYDARSGKRLWQFNAGLGIISAPMSFSAADKQYVSILVGYGGTTAAYGKFMDVGWKYGRQPRRLLTFALDGKAKLPPTPGPRHDGQGARRSQAGAERSRRRGRPGTVHSMRRVPWRRIASRPARPGPDLRESAIALELDELSRAAQGRSADGARHAALRDADR